MTTKYTVATSYLSTAMGFELVGDFTNAEKHFKRALKLYRTRKDKVGVYFHLQRIYELKGDHRSAFEFLVKEEQLCKYLDLISLAHVKKDMDSLRKGWGCATRSYVGYIELYGSNPNIKRDVLNYYFGDSLTIEGILNRVEFEIRKMKRKRKLSVKLSKKDKETLSKLNGTLKNYCDWTLKIFDNAINYYNQVRPSPLIALGHCYYELGLFYKTAFPNKTNSTPDCLKKSANYFKRAGVDKVKVAKLFPELSKFLIV